MRAHSSGSSQEHAYEIAGYAIVTRDRGELIPRGRFRVESAPPAGISPAQTTCAVAVSSQALSARFRRREQGLDVSRRPGDRRINPSDHFKSLLGQERGDLLDGALARLWILDHAALGDVCAPHLELGLDQRDQRPAGTKPRQNGGKNLGEGNEADVDGRQIDKLGNLHLGEIPGVNPFEVKDAGVGEQLRVKLAVPDIDRVDLARPGLKEAIGEATRACPDVRADFSFDGDAEFRERALELETPAGHVSKLLLDPDEYIRGNERARLVRALIARHHLTGED